MRNIFKVTAMTLLAIFVLAACGGNEGGASDEKDKADDDPLQVVTTFTLLEDMVVQIGGDRVEVDNLVPIGTDPHEYEPLPEDIKAATDADLLFFNGLNLEGGDDGWFAKLVNSRSEEHTSELQSRGH